MPVVIRKAPFKVPPADATLWRYLDLPKLLSMLGESSLHFCRATKFEDPYEGTFTKQNLEDNKRRFLANGNTEERWQATIKAMTDARGLVYVSCWNEHPRQSVAMWQLYCEGKFGLAIKTTTDNLVQSLRQSERDMAISKIEYIDYDSQAINIDQAYWSLFLHKRDCFSHEREVRVLFSSTTRPGDSIARTGQRTVAIHCELTSLIHEIHISPLGPPWFKRVVEDVLPRYGLNAPVFQSNLFQPP